MPELPEVETVRRGLEPTWVGNSFTHVHLARENLRWPFPEHFAARLEGRQVVSLNRRAKYLQAFLDNGEVLVMHLGMSGSFRVEEPHVPHEEVGIFHHPRSKNTLHDHVVFTFQDGHKTLYNDPRRFGFMLLIPLPELHSHALFASMGIEPLGNALSGEMLRAVMKDSRTPLKSALLDQRKIAGLGNIYVCEALFRSHLSPLRAAGSLRQQEAALLAEVIGDVLREAIAAGGSSLKDHTATDGSMGYFQHNFRVYDREGQPCTIAGCNGVVQRTVQAGRSTFWCAACQK